MPGAPATLGLLVLVPDNRLFVEIDQHQVGVVSTDNTPLVHQIPHASGCVAHPVDHLLQRAMPQMNLVEHQGQ